jgi:hypothetical protein
MWVIWSRNTDKMPRFPYFTLQIEKYNIQGRQISIKYFYKISGIYKVVNGDRYTYSDTSFDQTTICCETTLITKAVRYLF